MKILKLLLFPLALLYDLGTRIRNHLYNIGHKTSFSFESKVISVGNLNAGGSGKTPMVEYLLQLLKTQFAVVVLSRGYRRETHGYRLASSSDTAKTLGDEPMQLFRKFGSNVHIAVGEDRVAAIPNILHALPETDVIVLDDAFQHRAVMPSLSILVTDFASPFYEDWLLPMGKLRESRRGARRADIIVVTKCPPGLSKEKQQVIGEYVHRYAGNKPVFFSAMKYDDPISFGCDSEIQKQIILVSGVANATPLKEYLASRFGIVRHFNYPDHHRYSVSDLSEIEKCCKGQSIATVVVTTEKDMVKLISPELLPFIGRVPWFYLPVRHSFIEDGLKFDELILNAVNSPA